MVNIFKKVSQKLHRSNASTTERPERPATSHTDARHVTWDNPPTREVLNQELTASGFPKAYVDQAVARLPTTTTRSSKTFNVPATRADKPLPPLPHQNLKANPKSRRSSTSSEFFFEAYPDFEEVLQTQRNKKRWTKELQNDGEWATDTLEHAGISSAFPVQTIPRPRRPSPPKHPSLTRSGAFKRSAAISTRRREEAAAAAARIRTGELDSRNTGGSSWL